MNKNTNLNKIIDLLLAQRKELINKTYNLDIDQDGDEVDKLQANMLLGITSTLSERDKLKLNQIEQALSKVNNGNFGICEECEEPIAEKRLLINPYFKTCVVCAEKIEFENKQIGKR